MSKIDSSVDVLIAGAGPAGLMMACQLALHNISFRIIDKKASPTICSGALIIHARTLEILQQMGLAEKAIEKGIIARTINISFNKQKNIAIDFSEIGKSLTRFPFLLMLEQWQTENLLEEFLKEHNHKVENKAELVAFTLQNEIIISEIKKPDGSIEVVNSKFLIGADGNGSLVRTQLKIPFPGITHKPLLFITDCEARIPLLTKEILFAFSKKYTAGFFPLAGKGRRVDGFIPVLQGKEEVSFDEVKDFFGRNSDSGVELKNPQWFSIFRSHSRCAHTYRQNQCFLVGDAAHIHSPVGAQGMNTGIQDAYNLAWKLAFFIHNKASDNLLDSYEEERRPVALHVIRHTDFAYSFMTGNSRLKRILRLQLAPLFLPLLLKWFKKNSRISTRIFIWISGIGISYGKNLPRGLSNVNFPAHAPAPGERLPFLVFETGGKSIELCDILDSRMYSLVVFGKQEIPESFQKIIDEYNTIISVKHISDEPGTEVLFETFGIKSEGCYLVRPDMYIAWRSHEFHPTELSHYLQNQLK